jgi:oligo-1,6-glucosidase
MVYGEYNLLLLDHERLWAYTRTLDDTRWLVVLNVADERTAVPLGESWFDPADAEAELLLGNYADREAGADADLASLTMRPWEARVFQLR